MDKIIKIILFVILTNSCVNYKYSGELRELLGLEKIEFQKVDRETDNWLLDIEVYKLSDKTASDFSNNGFKSSDSVEYKWKFFKNDVIISEIENTLFASFGEKFKNHILNVKELFYNNSPYILIYNNSHTNIKFYIYDEINKLIYVLYYTL